MDTDTREVGYKVHGYGGPWSTWNWEWVEKTVWPMVSHFGASTYVIRLDIFLDKFPKIGATKTLEVATLCFRDGHEHTVTPI